MYILKEYFLKVELTHLAGPGVTQDSGHIDWGVCHDGVVVEFLLTLLFVFQLKGNMTREYYHKLITYLFQHGSIKNM